MSYERLHQPGSIDERFPNPVWLAGYITVVSTIITDLPLAFHASRELPQTVTRPSAYSSLIKQNGASGETRTLNILCTKEMFCQLELLMLVLGGSLREIDRA
jgi:hypothetical protein